jgi:hypothetical protein
MLTCWLNKKADDTDSHEQKGLKRLKEVILNNKHGVQKKILLKKNLVHWLFETVFEIIEI